MSGGIQDDSDLIWLSVRMIPRYKQVLSFLFGWSHGIRCQHPSIDLVRLPQFSREQTREQGYQTNDLFVEEQHCRRIASTSDVCTAQEGQVRACPPEHLLCQSRLTRWGHLWCNFWSRAAQRRCCRTTSSTTLTRPAQHLRDLRVCGVTAAPGVAGRCLGHGTVVVLLSSRIRLHGAVCV
jgi:hypothetical protein